MAKELAHFQNFAKLKDTKVAFNDITVIAGKPGIGKSYVMKFMYAVDESLRLWQKSAENVPDELEKLLKEHSDGGVKIKSALVDIFKNQLEKRYDLNTTDTLFNILKSIFTNLEQISTNFNINFNEDLVSYTSKSLTTTLDNINISNSVVFVETPLIIEFHNHMDRREAKTPYHIESLLNILDTDYSFTDNEQDKLIKEFSPKVNSIIGGDIKNRNGSFVFSRNDDKEYNIFNASSGTKSIGLLQYLVTNKALKKGSVLYWEEPEVHLHPEWQLRMIELFVELMNAGVKIVFSTHSPYMCDYLNAISKKQKFSDRVSFNLFEEKEGIVENHILENQKDWNKIQAELLDPLEEIMWEYV